MRLVPRWWKPYTVTWYSDGDGKMVVLSFWKLSAAEAALEHTRRYFDDHAMLLDHRTVA